MDVKFGKVIPSSMFSTGKVNSTEGNFFASHSNAGKNNQQNETNFGSRINDFDSNILENNAYLDISDEMLKLEHKIGILEATLAKSNSEIDALESLGYAIQISDLKERKRKIEEELAELNKKYSQLSLSSKISGHIASAVGLTSNGKNKTFSNVRKFISKNVLAKLSKKFGYSELMRESLEKLSCINANVDELINLQAPYGETITRYEKLTAYLNKANIIHSQISRNINETKKKKS